ncbi:MAG TPA: DUF5313 family protein [Jatrophihabitans sp.]|nr:DUF5313 family protein [Jatrophihabitans sp.]
MVRPGPLRWLWYSLGGSLPPRYAEWVLHDVTTRSWALRQALRSLMVVAPLVAAVLIFVPGPFWVRAVSAVGGIIMGLIFALGYLVETTEHRLVKAGYPVGTGERVRAERQTQAHSAAVARRREKMFARMDRRLR